MLHGGYPNVPYAGKRGSNYIDLPNSHYDRTEGQRVLERQLDTFVALETMGYDGGVVSEQHNGPIGLLGNPLLAGAFVAARTSSIKIGVVGPIINAYLSPVRMAEEVAALDTMSRGRLLLGLPMGHGMQYHSMGVINPATARARYREAHDLFIKALTHEGPFEWFGEFYQIPYVNLWPKTVQDPHPEILILGGGSQETLELVADKRYGYQSVGLNSMASIAKTMGRFRDLCRQRGYEADRRQIWASVNIHVAETDEQARLEAEAHALWLGQNFFRSHFHDNFPPGYLSQPSMRGVLGGGYRSKSTAKAAFDAAVESGNLIVGSPDTVAAGMERLFAEMDPGRVLLDPLGDTKPAWLVNKTLSLFAEEVLPRLREGGVPPGQHTKLAGYESLAEYGARKDRTLPAPTVTLGDGLIDASTSHVASLRQPVEPGEFLA
ncbi:LLM class flavin-dependent oxidoreductase [Modestobacter sp. VKM Ac-2978]|uniref:LLM class flavin-dependent oxidoreductase n=1 Tax=Modestobacter sp. VKM Ac-2978 TaxID=3004132 RepID=UPI0022AB4BC0|nr:LLM class flavin-dependent oxidoreductase [Modestobacter sp. VKM Ac-2978]MCZ2849908.1 LLM class flavin-dependent oxidoreductase [Modestobacter sp. VKM Ac-2978]